MRPYSLADLLNYLISLIFGIISLGLVIRFLLRLLGANPNSGFAEFIYSSTNPLLEPFSDIFSPVVVEPGNILEISTLFALLIYAIFFYLLSEFVSYISYNATQTYRRRV